MAWAFAIAVDEPPKELASAFAVAVACEVFPPTAQHYEYVSHEVITGHIMGSQRQHVGRVANMCECILI
jgi:hypothetical protein